VARTAEKELLTQPLGCGKKALCDREDKCSGTWQRERLKSGGSFANQLGRLRSSLGNMTAHIHLDVFPYCNITTTFLSSNCLAFGKELQV